MILLNFSHPITPEQKQQIEALTGQEVEQIRDIRSQIDHNLPLAPQIIAMADAALLTSNDWQTLPVVVNLPALSASAGALLAELHGRMGYFPPILKLRQIANLLPPKFEVAEVVNLQELRTQARWNR